MAEAQTLTQVNQEFQQGRVNRLDAAITSALAAKLPPAPKAGSPAGASKRSAASTPASPAPASGSQTSATPSLSTPSTSSDGSSESSGSDTQSDAPSPEELGLATDGAATDEPQDGAAEGQGTVPDPTALALARKRDLRALEKHYGLPEGILGATNGDYAAYRRREEAVASREKEVTATHEANNQKLIGKFGPVVDLIDAAQKGSIQAYAALIERTTGVRIAAFVDHWSKNMPAIDPRVMQLERENAELRARGGIVDTKGEPAPQTTAVVTADAATKRANEYLTASAKDHAALKLKGGLDEVRQKWLGSYDKRSNSFGLSPQQAADAVVADRKRAREQDDWVLSGRKPVAKPRTRAIPRTGASEARAPAPARKVDLSAKEGRQELIEKGAAMVRTLKQRDAALGTRR